MYAVYRVISVLYISIWFYFSPFLIIFISYYISGTANVDDYVLSNCHDPDILRKQQLQDVYARLCH